MPTPHARLMPDPDLDLGAGVTLLGAGPVDAATLEEALGLAPTLIAADGGANTARTLNKKITAIIGDLDSLTSHEYWRKSGTPIFRVDEQETTDFEKCLAATRAGLTLAVGFLGGRIDHELAVMSALVRAGARAVVVIGAEDVIFHAARPLRLDLPVGSRVSIYPLAETRGTASRGLVWSLEDLTLAPDGRIGTSNRVAASPVELAFDRPGALVLLPRAALAASVAALAAS